jgi:hypothetical protein
MYYIKFLVFFFALLKLNTGFAQLPESLKNKWCFFREGILFFSENNGKAFVEFAEQDNQVFIDLYTKGQYFASKYKDTLKVIDSSKGYRLQSAMRFYLGYGKRRDTVVFWIKKNNIIQLSGKPVNETRISKTSANKNCDTTQVFCAAYLYETTEFEKLKKLKSVEEMSKPDLEKFLDKLEKSLKTTCNLCNEGAMVAEINRIVVEMGYNPISSRTTQYSTYYKTSAVYHLSYLISAKYSELQPRYAKIRDSFYAVK